MDQSRFPSSLEKEVLQRLLEPLFPSQSHSLIESEEWTVRELDCNGSLEVVTSPESTRMEVVARIPVEGEFTDSDGVKAHVLLHVVDGRIREVEVYKEDSSNVKERSRLKGMTIVESQ